MGEFWTVISYLGGGILGYQNHELACKHCAALFLVKPSVGFIPKIEYRNATISFVESNGSLYGITCKHVIEELRKKKEELDDPNLCFATIVNRNVFILDRFQFPPPAGLFVGRPPDLAIRQLHPKLCESVGKQPFSFSKSSDLIGSGTKRALAVGYPEELKATQETMNLPGHQVKMPCVHALSEVSGVGSEDLTLFSELSTRPEAISLSGMSGGPIFWSEANSYGLLGITKQALPTESDVADGLGEKPRISIIGQRITYDLFDGWVRQLGIDKNQFHDELMNITLNISLP